MKKQRTDEQRDWYEYLTVEDFYTPAKGSQVTDRTQDWLKRKPDAVYVHELRGFKRSKTD